MVLLDLVSHWCQSLLNPPELLAWHINHNLAPQAGEWEAHCRHICEQRGLSFQSSTVAVTNEGKGLEAAARDARYRLFEEGLVEGDVLLTGHHLDDQAETFFLRLLRGAGPAGLRAMAPERALGAARLLRPLLSVPRSQLRTHAEARQLPYLDDPANDDLAFDRNYLRHQVLPALEQRWPGYRKTLARAIEHMGDFNPPAGLVATHYSALGDPGIALADLALDDERLAAHQIRAWLSQRALAMPATLPLREFLRQLREAGDGCAATMQNGTYALQYYRRCVYLRSAIPFQPPAVTPRLSSARGCDIPGVGACSLEPAAGAGLALAPDDTLTVVWRRGGERVRLAGRGPGHRSLKKLLHEAGVPPWWRERIPLLCFQGEIVAIGDLFLCESPAFSAPGQLPVPLWQPRWQRNTSPAFD